MLLRYYYGTRNAIVCMNDKVTTNLTNNSALHVTKDVIIIRNEKRLIFADTLRSYFRIYDNIKIFLRQKHTERLVPCHYPARVSSCESR